MFEKNILHNIRTPKTEEIQGHWKTFRKDDRNILNVLKYNLSHYMKENEKAGRTESVSEIS